MASLAEEARAGMATTVTVAEVRRTFGFSLAEIRSLDEQGVLPVLWTGKRSGRVFTEDLERLKAERFTRARGRARQREMKVGYVKGGTPRAAPEFLRTKKSISA